ncbi:MAG: fused MFS/spermidine synthase [Verrucomicrobia bacterium]|nr:fused MFS/spermidine synthase [Verrucomicrobiota bacterium]
MIDSAPLTGRTRLLVLLAVGGLGVCAVMTQLSLMRELLGAFSGNELVFGISLGSWLLLTGAGTWLGRLSVRLKEPDRALITGMILVAIIPLGQLVAVRVLRDVVFLRGAAVGVTETVLGSMALLLPFCVVSGAMLTLACGFLARREGASGIGRVYVADTLGSIAGGILFSFVLVPWLDHFALLCFPAALNLLLAAVLAGHFRRRLLLASTVMVALGLTVHVLLIDTDDLTTAIQHWGQTTVFRANSPYGRLVVTDASGQLTFYENGVPVISTHNIDQVEETVHYAMSQRPDAREVLLLGGGVSGTAREILRYGVAGVTYVEIDPLIIEVGRRFLPYNLADARIRTIATDGRRFVQQTGGHYDVVIVDLPDPSTSQLNRFHTAEFFAEVRSILNPDGVLAFALGRYENFVSPELARLLASAHRTLLGSFGNVRMIPGGRVFFLASDGPLSLDIAARLEKRGLATKLVNRHYLDAMLAPDRLADLDRAVAQPAEINTDFNPMLYYYHQRHWLSQFTGGSVLSSGRVLGWVLLAILAAYLIGLRAVPRVIFASGFAASALEVVLLLGYQVLYGSLYQQVGLVVTVFMAGLAAGAWRANRQLDNATSVRLAPLRILLLMSCAIAVLAALLPFILPQFVRLDTFTGSSLSGQGIILLLTFLLAALVGGQFPLAGAAGSGGAAATASRLYTADLVGAAMGALLASAMLIPLFGVTAVCLLTAALNLAAAAIAWRMTTSA